MENQAKEIVDGLSTTYCNNVPAQEMSEIISCFYGRSIQTVCKKDFKFLKGEIVLLRQIKDFVKKKVEVKENDIIMEYKYLYFNLPKHKKKNVSTNIAAMPFGTAFVDNYDWNVVKKSKELNRVIQNNANHTTNPEDEAIVLSNTAISVLADVLRGRCFEILKSGVKDYVESVQDINLKANERKDSEILIESMLLIKPDNLSNFMKKNLIDVKFTFQIVCYCNEKFKNLLDKNLDAVGDSSAHYRFNDSLRKELWKILTKDEENMTAVLYKEEYEAVFQKFGSSKSLWFNNYTRHLISHKNKQKFKGNLSASYLYNFSFR